MTGAGCPNYNECALVREKLALEGDVYRYYIDSYCCGEEEEWLGCMRFKAKEKLNFCPDFVLPDSVMTIDQIIDRFDMDNN